jgi:hypothetical protein
VCVCVLYLLLQIHLLEIRFLLRLCPELVHVSELIERLLSIGRQCLQGVMGSRWGYLSAAAAAAAAADA